MTKKTDTPDTEIFIDKKTADDPWVAKPLTLEGTARLITLLSKLTDDMARKAAIENLLAQEEGRVPVDKPLWVAFTGVLGGDEIQELLCIITGKSPTWVKKNYRLEDATRAIRQFFDNENIGDVVKNLMGTATQAVPTVGLVEPLTDSSTNTAEQSNTG